jgi:hypothetical protein
VRLLLLLRLLRLWLLLLLRLLRRLLLLLQRLLEELRRQGALLARTWLALVPLVPRAPLGHGCHWCAQQPQQQGPRPSGRAGGAAPRGADEARRRADEARRRAQQQRLARGW